MGLSGKEKGAAQGGCAPPPLPLVLLGLGEVAGHPSPSFPLGNPSWNRIGGGKEEGGPAPSPCPIRTKGGEGHAAHLWLPLLFSTKAHISPGGGGSGNLPVLK